MKGLVLVLLLPLLCESDVEMLNEYVFVSEPKDWYNAQTYCRQKHEDMARVLTEADQLSIGQFERRGWIGLLRNLPMVNNWQWTDGEHATFFKWSPGQPDNSQNSENCGEIQTTGWNDNSCSEALPFFCQRKIVLVKESMTWTEAFHHCKKNYKRLASAESAVPLAVAGTYNQTVAVWTGLLFLDHKWIWVNKREAAGLTSFPQCSAGRCGALDANRKVLENRDCGEKLYFFCH